MDATHDNRFSTSNDHRHWQQERRMAREVAHMPDGPHHRLRERQQARRNERRLAERGSGTLLATLNAPLLDTEVLGLEVDFTWRTLFPDAEDADVADEGEVDEENDETW